jgi:DNA-binding MurR/RpiR family transcriptional regulator
MRSAGVAAGRLEESLARLKGSRRRLAGAILSESPETYHLSSHDLARRYGVDAATVIRTVQALGYGTFAEFAADLRRHFVRSVTPASILRDAARGRGTAADHVRRSLESDAAGVRALAEALPARDVVEAARQIRAARRVMVVGVDLAASLAEFLAYGLSVLGIDATAPAGSSGHLLHRGHLLGRRDLLVAISFGRCLRQTVTALLRARKAGVPTLAVTDSPASPLAQSARRALLCSVESPAVTGSYAAPMAVLNAVLVACGRLGLRRSLRALDEKERDDRAALRWYGNDELREETHR